MDNNMKAPALLAAWELKKSGGGNKEAAGAQEQENDIDQDTTKKTKDKEKEQPKTKKKKAQEGATKTKEVPTVKKSSFGRVIKPSAAMMNKEEESVEED